jgi:diguanylate cyclase (GGDEF)-like protein
MEIVRDVVEGRGDGFRTGGDEVLCSLPGATLEQATRIAETIRRAVEADFREKQVPATTSIGVATFIARVDPNEAAEFVDKRLYEAKNGGRNRVCAQAFST